MTATIAIAGRPNVGKSTLFNRLTGTRAALVHDMPGVTRDRKEGKVSMGGIDFILVDTAGLEHARSKDALAQRMTEQSLKAVKDASATLFVLDAVAGVTPQDKEFAKILRKSAKKVILLANKVDTKSAKANLAEMSSLGFGDAIAISAEHGQGISNVLSEIAEVLPEEPEVLDEEQDSKRPIRIAIIGRPNAGKSTLINALLKDERVLTGPEAGLTRDAITVPFAWSGRTIELVDTAGLRRSKNVDEALEKLARMDARRSIQFADVVIMVIDASAPMEKQDLTIAGDAAEEGRAIVLAVNKTDTVTQVPLLIEDISDRLSDILPQLKGLPVIPLCALKKTGLAQVMNAAIKQYDLWNTKITTSQLNRWLEAALEKHQPPLINGRRLKIRYLTQTSTRPPTFKLFVNLSEMPGHYLRYLTTSLRDAFKLPGIPLRLQIKKGENPYAKN